MKKGILVLVVFIGMATLAMADVWTQKASLPSNTRYLAACFSIGTMGYICEGIDSINVFHDLWQYDQTTNAWTQKADYPDTTTNAIYLRGFSLGSIGFVMSEANWDCYGYDTASNAWSPKAYNPFPASIINRVAFTIGNKAYSGTGMLISGSESYKDFWEYDPSLDAWTQKADVGTGDSARCSAIAFSINGKGYIGGGEDDGFLYGVGLNDFWEYDTATNAWTQKSNIPQMPSYGSTFVINGKGYSIITKANSSHL